MDSGEVDEEGNDLVREERESTANPAEILGRLYLLYREAYDSKEALGTNLLSYAVIFFLNHFLLFDSILW